MSKQLGKATSCLGPCEPLRQPCLHPTPPRVQLPMTPYSAHVCARRPVPKLTWSSPQPVMTQGWGSPARHSRGGAVTEAQGPW